MRQLTERQAEIFSWIKKKILGGVPPTVRETSIQFEMSPNGAQCVIRYLKAKGYLRSIPRQARNLRLTKRGKEW